MIPAEDALFVISLFPVQRESGVAVLNRSPILLVFCVDKTESNPV